MNNRVFVSLPYTHPDREVVEQRLLIVRKYFIKLLQKGFCPVIPIIVGDPIVQQLGLDNSFEYWKDYCLTELKSCDRMHVLMIDGWESAYGVQVEIQHAKMNQIEIEYIKLTKEIN